MAENQNTECLCGCGEIPPFYKGKQNKFIHGHNSRRTFNPRYKGYKFSTHDPPRKMLYMPWHPNAEESGYVYEYVWLMSRHLKRKLEKGEVIHHIDGNPQNNLITNLQLIPNQSEHMAMTMKKNMDDRKCSICGKTETQINLGKYVAWYGNEKDGWLCRPCYCRKNYKYVKKGRKKKNN
jgi:hypothetical protein